MALQQKSKVDWDDIAALFVSLNAQRTRMEYNALSYPNPNNKKRTKTSESLEPLVDGIEEMLNNQYVQGSGVSISDIVIPAAKTRMKPDPFNKVQAQIDKLAAVNFGFNGSGFNASNFGHSSCFEEECFSNGDFGFGFQGHFTPAGCPVDCDAFCSGFTGCDFAGNQNHDVT